MKRISSKLFFISLLLGGSIITVILSTIMINQKDKNDAFVINIAGKERMLTQKITKEVFLKYALDRDSGHDLAGAKKEFETNLYNLIHGNEELGIYAPPNKKIENELSAIDEEWGRFGEQVDIFSENIGSFKKASKEYIDENEKLLNISEDIVKLSSKLNFSPSFVDVAGKQRMLTQKMAFNLERYKNYDKGEFLHSFNDAKEEYRQNLNKLAESIKEENSGELEILFQKNKEIFVGYEKSIDEFLKLKDIVYSSLNYVAQNNKDLLNLCEKTVTSYTDYSEDKRDALESFQYISGITILFLVIYSFTVIRGIKNHFEEFVQKSKMLANLSVEDVSKVGADISVEGDDELSEASGNIAKFINKVNSLIETSSKAQNLSEQIADEISSIVESMIKNLDTLDISQEERDALKKEINRSEDIAIESSEELINAVRMLKKLSRNLQRLESKKALD